MLSDGFDIQSLTSFRVPGPLPWSLCTLPHSSLRTTGASRGQGIPPRLLHCASCARNQSSIPYREDLIVILIYLTHNQSPPA